MSGWKPKGLFYERDSWLCLEQIAIIWIRHFFVGIWCFPVISHYNTCFDIISKLQSLINVSNLITTLDLLCKMGK